MGVYTYRGESGFSPLACVSVLRRASNSHGFFWRIVDDTLWVRVGCRPSTPPSFQTPGAAT